MSVNRVFVIRTRMVISVGLVLAVGAGCSRQSRNAGRQRLVAEQRATLCHSLEWFRAQSIIVPDGGTVVDVKEYLKCIGIYNDVNTAVAHYGLDLEDLDENELVLFLFSGILRSHPKGHLEWLSINEIVHRHLFQFEAFDPDPRWVVDTDNDGWPEYSLPGTGMVRLLQNRFAFPFSCSRQQGNQQITRTVQEVMKQRQRESEAGTHGKSDTLQKNH